MESLCLSLDDIEEDFDPKEYDAKMTSLFNDEYYAAGGEDQDKPVFPDIEEDGNPHLHTCNIHKYSNIVITVYCSMHCLCTVYTVYER